MNFISQWGQIDSKQVDRWINKILDSDMIPYQFVVFIFMSYAQRKTILKDITLWTILGITFKEFVSNIFLFLLSVFYISLYFKKKLSWQIPDLWFPKNLRGRSLNLYEIYLPPFEVHVSYEGFPEY